MQQTTANISVPIQNTSFLSVKFSSPSTHYYFYWTSVSAIYDSEIPLSRRSPISLPPCTVYSTMEPSTHTRRRRLPIIKARRAAGTITLPLGSNQSAGIRGRRERGLPSIMPGTLHGHHPNAREKHSTPLMPHHAHTAAAHNQMTPSRLRLPPAA
jgi:hypothetical protein